MSERFALARIEDERTARVALNYIVPLGHEITGGLLHAHGAVQTLQFALDSRAPFVLWVKGSRAELLTRPVSERVSILGARSASGRGMYDADQLAVGLSLQDVTIVSTASPGIARAALAGPQRGPGGAITVLTHALEDPDAITPNGFLASIGENGLLVSECPPGRTPGRDSLHSQRRIVAALAAVTTVIESGPHGDAVQTALVASALHRQVAVIEGEPGTVGSLGPRLLLEQSGATPVRSRDDVTTLLTVKPLATLSDLMPLANRASPPNPTLAAAQTSRPHHATAREALVLSR